MFRLTVPATDGADELKAPDAEAAGGAALAGRRVLVIDDDPAVRQSMPDLLSGWGAHGLAAEGGDEAALRCPAHQPPDVVVCDYRLREGETGSGVIKRLRELWSFKTPALLVTGDTAPERLRDATASGVPLLHKPVAPETLFHGLVRAFRVRT